MLFVHDEDLYCDNVLVCISLSVCVHERARSQLTPWHDTRALSSLALAEVLGCKVTWVLQYSISPSYYNQQFSQSQSSKACIVLSVTTSEHFSSMVDVAQNEHKLYHLIMFSLNESSMFFVVQVYREFLEYCRYIFTFFHIYLVVYSRTGRFSNVAESSEQIYSSTSINHLDHHNHTS
jgi:hypothetical protein